MVCTITMVTPKQSIISSLHQEVVLAKALQGSACGRFNFLPAGITKGSMVKCGRKVLIDQVNPFLSGHASFEGSW